MMAEEKIKEFRYAFMQSIPVMLGYLFLGIAFGLMLQHAGYSYSMAFFCSLFIYAGSMQFVLVSLLTSGANVLYAAVMTLFINGRHIFYGFSFIEKFRKMGKMYPYMVFSLTDETYSVLCGLNTPKEMDEGKVSFYIAILDHFYWITGSVLGAIAGDLIKIDTTGIDFSMTALFVVIVLNQWMENSNHKPVLIGTCVGIGCLLFLGEEKFLLPALLFTALILLGGKKVWNIQ